MNGKALQQLLQEVGQLDDAQWRGYLAAKIEDIKEVQSSLKKDLSTTQQCLTSLKVDVAKLPVHCTKGDEFGRIHAACNTLNTRVLSLEKDKAGRKAVNKVVFGAGGVSIFSLLIMLLKFVFKAF